MPFQKSQYSSFPFGFYQTKRITVSDKNLNGAPASTQFFLNPISVPPGNIVGLSYGRYKSMPFFIPAVTKNILWIIRIVKNFDLSSLKIIFNLLNLIKNYLKWRAIWLDWCRTVGCDRNSWHWVDSVHRSGIGRVHGAWFYS